MGIFDLVLIATVLGTLGGVVSAVVLWACGRRRGAKRILQVLGGYLAIYAVALVTTSVFSPRKEVAIGEEQRFDDWCLRVVDVGYENDSALAQGRAHNVIAVVTVEVSNRGRGRAQSEPGTFLYVVDDQGRTYRHSDRAQEEYERTHGTAPLITSMIRAGESIVCMEVFEVPRDARRAGLVIGRPFGPGRFVIGDSDSFFHRETVVLMPDFPAE